MDNTYENIDLETLPLINIALRKGIYFLYRGSELVYIGQTKNLYRRLSDHLCDQNKEFDSFKFLEVNGNIDLLDLEWVLIKRFKPKYNKNKKENFTKDHKKAIALKWYYKNKNKIKVTTNISIL